MATIRSRLTKVETKIRQANILPFLVVLVTSEEEMRQAEAEHGPDRELGFVWDYSKPPPGQAPVDYPGSFPPLEEEGEAEVKADSPQPEMLVEKSPVAKPLGERRSTGGRVTRRIKVKARKPGNLKKA